ncbi:DUF6053 domain-containing protein [Lysobacter yananisis]
MRIAHWNLFGFKGRLPAIGDNSVGTEVPPTKAKASGLKPFRRS